MVINDWIMQEDHMQFSNNNYLILLGKNIIKFPDCRNDPRSVSMHWPYAFIINIQKDANKRKLIQAGRTNLAIYTCTKFVVRFVYVDTNNSERSWQILYVNPYCGT